MTEASAWASLHESRCEGSCAANLMSPFGKAVRGYWRKPRSMLGTDPGCTPSGPRRRNAHPGQLRRSPSWGTRHLPCMARAIVEAMKRGSRNVRKPVGFGDSAPHSHCHRTRRAIAGRCRRRTASAVDHALARSSCEGGPGCSMMKSPPCRKRAKHKM